MKLRWEEPKILVQQFLPNEYVAACGDSGTVYNFECNAGVSGKHYAVVKDGTGTGPNNPKVYLKSSKGIPLNGMDQPGQYGQGAYYTSCFVKHEASTESDFITGYHLDDPSTQWTDENISVIIWTAGGTDTHATTNLDMNTWETAKS